MKLPKAPWSGMANLSEGGVLSEFVTWLDVLQALPLDRARSLKVTRTRGDEVYTCEMEIDREEETNLSGDGKVDSFCHGTDGAQRSGGV